MITNFTPIFIGPIKIPKEQSLIVLEFTFVIIS